MLKVVRMLSFTSWQFMNTLVNENPGIDGGTAYIVLGSQLPVSKSLRQIFIDGLLFNVHKFTFLCKPISGRDNKMMKLTTSSHHIAKQLCKSSNLR